MVTKKSRKKLRKELRKQSEKQFSRQKLLNKFAAPGCFDFIVVLDNLKPDFNIGKIFRTADALGAYEIHIIGTNFFEPGPAKGSFKWIPARFHDTFDLCYKELTDRRYDLFVLEPFNSQLLYETKLAKRSAFIFGHEEYGISFDKSNYPTIQSIRIPQFGKVQSLNVSIAASLVMYEYVRQLGAEVTVPAPKISNR